MAAKQPIRTSGEESQTGVWIRILVLFAVITALLVIGVLFTLPK